MILQRLEKEGEDCVSGKGKVRVAARERESVLGGLHVSVVAAVGERGTVCGGI